MAKITLKLPKARIVEKPASLLKRAMAFVLDIFIISIIISPFQSVIEKLIPKDIGYMDLISLQHSELLTKISFIISLVSIVYFATLEKKFGQTIGKMMMGITVVSDEKELSLWQCIVRNLFLLPIMPFVLLWVIDPLYLVFTRRRFSDALARTRVIERYADLGLQGVLENGK